MSGYAGLKVESMSWYLAIKIARVLAQLLYSGVLQNLRKADAFGVLGLLPKILGADTIRYRLLQRVVHGGQIRFRQ